MTAASWVILLPSILFAQVNVDTDTLPGFSMAEPSIHGVLELLEPDEEIPLPGTQPLQHGSDLMPSRAHAIDGYPLEQACKSCHAGFSWDSPFDGWKGTMMAQAWRDPVARAAIAVANHDLETVEGVPAGDWCTRCHAPEAWLEGLSLPADGSEIAGSGAEGVTCAICHRMVDPVEATASCDPAEAEGPFDCGGVNFRGRVDQYDNSQYVIDPGIDEDGDGTFDRAVMHGPREFAFSPAHETAGGSHDFVSTSDHCGTCHNVTNPVVRVPSTEELEGAMPVHLASSHAPIAGKPMPIERTHVEWAMSDHATDGPSCQACHMGTAPGFSAIGGTEYPDLRLHETAGGNAWVPSIIPLFFPDQATPAMTAALERAAEAARTTLSRAATLSVERAASGHIVFRVTNETGHKLPTGYPEGRRMWLEVEGLDAAGAVVFRSGHYDPLSAELAREDTLGHPTKIWEILLGIYDRETRTAEHTFHFALNDVVVKANRIPPRGFRIDEGARQGALIIRDAGECARLPADLRTGCESYDWIAEPAGQERKAESWDLVPYELPSDVVRVRATLWYQTSSKEYVEFLANPVNSGDYADRFVLGLAEAWALTGKSAPVRMTGIEATLPGT